MERISMSGFPEYPSMSVSPHSGRPVGSRRVVDVDDIDPGPGRVGRSLKR